MSALEGLTRHQRSVLLELSCAKAPGLVRSRRVGESAARALEARGLARRWMHEHTSKTRRGAGYRLSFHRIERIEITPAGRAAARALVDGVLP